MLIKYEHQIVTGYIRYKFVMKRWGECIEVLMECQVCANYGTWYYVNGCQTWISKLANY